MPSQRQLLDHWISSASDHTQTVHCQGHTYNSCGGTEACFLLVIRSRGLQQVRWGPRPGNSTWPGVARPRGLQRVQLSQPLVAQFLAFENYSNHSIHDDVVLRASWKVAGAWCRGPWSGRISCPHVSRYQTAGPMAVVLKKTVIPCSVGSFAYVCRYGARALSVSCQFVLGLAGASWATSARYVRA